MQADHRADVDDLGGDAGALRHLPHKRLVRAVVGVLGDRKPLATRVADLAGRRETLDDAPRQFALLEHRRAEQHVALQRSPDRVDHERRRWPCTSAV